MRRGSQTHVTSASFTTSPPPILSTSIREFKYEPPKQERFDEEDDEDEDDYDEDDNFVEDEARDQGREIIGPVARLYLMPYVYKGRFLTHNMASVRMVI